MEIVLENDIILSKNCQRNELGRFKSQLGKAIKNMFLGGWMGGDNSRFKDCLQQ